MEGSGFSVEEGVAVEAGEFGFGGEGFILGEEGVDEAFAGFGVIWGDFEGVAEEFFGEGVGFGGLSGPCEDGEGGGVLVFDGGGGELGGGLWGEEEGGEGVGGGTWGIGG